MGIRNSSCGHVRFRGSERMVFDRARPEGLGWFPVTAWSKRGSRHGLHSAQNA